MCCLTLIISIYVYLLSDIIPNSFASHPNEKVKMTPNFSVYRIITFPCTIYAICRRWGELRKLFFQFKKQIGAAKKVLLLVRSCLQGAVTECAASTTDGFYPWGSRLCNRRFAGIDSFAADESVAARTIPHLATLERDLAYSCACFAFLAESTW